MGRGVTVMVVEDSAVVRELLVDTLNSDPRITVIAAVETGEAAVRLAPRLAPDVISMDLRLPGMSGIEATRRIMAIAPTPVIVVASDVSRATTASAMEALRAGALVAVEKPSVANADAYRAMAARLCDQFVALSALKVVRRRFPQHAANAAHPGRPVAEALVPLDVVGIAASTGGPPAIASVLQSLPPDFPAPVLVVQHMGAAFIEGFAEWLSGNTGLEVSVAREGELAQSGHVYVGPGGRHLTYRSGAIRLAAPDGEGSHVPSADALFQSLAACGPRAAGVILTGMGDDGADGLLALRTAGGMTLAQDRASSAVYGMPGVARARGAVAEELPLGLIGARLARLALRQEPAVRRRVAQ